MQNFLSEHEPGCTPSSPCASCQVGAFLRSRLSGQDFAKLMEMLSVPSRTQALSAVVGVAPLDTPIEDLELSTRSYYGLKNDRIKTVGELAQKTEAELSRVPNLGPLSLTNIKDALAKVGHRLSLPLLARPINELEMSVRTSNLLAGIETIEQLADKTARELLSIRGFGRTSLNEVEEILHALALKLADAPSRR